MAFGGCPNEQLRAENNSLGLPDCRAFEMVTPADKNSALVEPVAAATVAADGSSLAGRTYEGFAGIENDESEADGGPAYYRFSRTASGWVTRPLNPYRGEMVSIGVGDSVWQSAELYVAPRLRLRAEDGSLSEVGLMWPLSLGGAPLDFPFQVLSAAAEAVNGIVFAIYNPAFSWPFDSTVSGFRLYEYKGTGNAAPSLVGVNGGAGSTALISQCGTELAGRENGKANAVSEDGATVFFVATGADRSPCGGAEPPVNELFARVGGERTVAISEPSVVDCSLCDTSTPGDAVFQGASADGSKVFFTTKQALLGQDTSENLYEYDFDAPAGEPRVTRVSAGDESVSVPTAQVQGVSAISEDGSHVYFTAKGVLTTAANGAGEHARAGAENLYMYERDSEYPAGRTAFITTCSDIGGPDEERQVTPGGSFLVFTSGCRLTPGDMGAARQVFQYDAQTGGIVRVSGGLEGYDDDGNVAADPNGGLSARIVGQRRPSGVRGGALVRTMSDDGSFVFFESPVGLTPGALNEVPAVTEGEEAASYAENVYEFHDGRVSLIGSDASPAYVQSNVALIGTTASGGDVFFRTEDQLVPQDTDTGMDFYDARVGGGFPAPVVSAECVGDACQGSPSSPPGFGAPSSVVFSGGGNLAPPGSGPVAVVAPKALTAAQKLSRALKACLKEPRRRRASCEAQAKRRYGRSSRAVKSDRRGH